MNEDDGSPRSISFAMRGGDFFRLFAFSTLTDVMIFRRRVEKSTAPLEA